MSGKDRRAMLPFLSLIGATILGSEGLEAGLPPEKTEYKITRLRQPKSEEERKARKQRKQLKKRKTQGR